MSEHDYYQLLESLQKFFLQRGLDDSSATEKFGDLKSSEMAEVQEHLQLLEDEETSAYIKENKGEIAFEAADVLIYLMRLRVCFVFDLLQVVAKKMEKTKKSIQQIR